MRFRQGTLQVAGDVVARPVRDDLVLVDLRRGEYFSLNETGRAIWSALPTVEHFDDLVSGLLDEFDGDAVSIRREVESLLDRLIEAGLLEITEARR